MPTLTGSITISDLLDGVTGVSVLIENEAHTFIAAADGSISNGELTSFDTDIRVFAGSDEYTYTSSAPGPSEWRVGTGGISYTPTSPNPDITATVAAVTNQVYANLTIADAGGSNTGFDDVDTTVDSMTIVIPIEANIAGTTVTVNKTISLTKAKGGDAKIVRMTANRQTMEYAFGATSPKSTEDNLVFTSSFINFGSDSSDASWTYSVNGGSFNAIDADSGTVSGGNNSTLTVTPAQFDHAIDEGTEATYVTYRATRSSVFDQISAVLLRDAEGGYSVIIEVDGGVQVFKNDPFYLASDASTYANLKAYLYRGGIDISTDSSVSYVWQKDGTDLTAATEGSLLVNGNGNVAQPSGYGRTTRQIRVGAGTIDDNGSNRFSVKVTF